MIFFPDLRPKPPALTAIPAMPFHRGAKSPGMSRLVFSIAPLIIIVLFSIPILTVLTNLLRQDQGTLTHLIQTVFASYIVNSFILLIGVVAGTCAVGVGAAWLIVSYRFPGRKFFEWALVLPLATPAYIMGYAYADFFQSAGVVQTMLRHITGWSLRDYWFPDIRSLGGAVLIFVVALYPYVYLLARAAFLDQSTSAMEVARTLTRNSWRSFFYIALPLARPALAAGLTLVAMETLADYGVVDYFGIPTLTVGVYRAWFSMGDHIASAQLASFLLLFIGMLILCERLARGQRRFHGNGRRHTEVSGKTIKGGKAALASLACFLPLFFGFLLPIIILLRLAFLVGDAQFGYRYIILIGNSVRLAAVVAVLAVVLAVLLVYGKRLYPKGPNKVGAIFAGLGYAVPGSVIAVGVLLPFAWTDNAVDAFMRQHFGISTGLMLTGSLVALVAAYLVRFLAIAVQTVDAGFTKISPVLDDAARVLGAHEGRRLWQVYRPLLRRSVLAAGLLVFVDAIKELPATMILQPFNFSTLAVQAHKLASDERLAEASTAALVIVLVGLLPVILIARNMAATRNISERFD